MNKEERIESFGRLDEDFLKSLKYLYSNTCHSMCEIKKEVPELSIERISAIYKGYILVLSNNDYSDRKCMIRIRRIDWQNNLESAPYSIAEKLAVEGDILFKVKGKWSDCNIKCIYTIEHILFAFDNIKLYSPGNKTYKKAMLRLLDIDYIKRLLTI